MNSLLVSESRDGLEELQRIQASHIIKVEKNGQGESNRRYPNDLRRTVAATGFKRFLGIPDQMAKNEIQQNETKEEKSNQKTEVVFTVQSRTSARREKDEVSRLPCAHVMNSPANRD